jgi:serine/threonine protein kinase
VVDTLVEDETPPSRPSTRTAPEAPTERAATHDVPAMIGRYRVLGIIGQGGMGVVLKAEDPQLVRTIAIKLVRPRKGPVSTAAEDRARLLREARALAALSHPNVVPVYDVGEHGDSLFIAMQFIGGANMRVWLEREKPGYKRVLGVMRAAGRGLAAAHAAGIVHRDFKPANVLVGDDGRVRVLDFGLARAHESADGGAATGDLAVLGGVTQAGVLVGTPAYMAPEQFGGGIGDARADQYAFCVSMFEALYGFAPFTANDFRSLVTLKRAGRIADRPPSTTVPDDLHAVMLRGMSTDPADRFASMPDLLRELRRIGEASESVPARPVPPTHRWIGLGATILLVAVVVALTQC